MNIKEELQKVYEEEQLRELATKRKNIEKKLFNSIEKIQEHLLKIFVDRDRDSVEHWCNELFGFLNWIPKLKWSNKRPSPKYIYDNICGDYIDEVDVWFPNMLQTLQVSNKISNINVKWYDIKDAFTKFYKEYCKWISNELSNSGSVSLEDIKDKIQELLEKY